MKFVLEGEDDPDADLSVTAARVRIRLFSGLWKMLEPGQLYKMTLVETDEPDEPEEEEEDDRK